MMRLKLPAFCCSSRIRSDRRIGRPASCSVESCRANCVTYLTLTLAPAPRRFLALAAALLPPRLGGRGLGADLRGEVPHVADLADRFLFAQGLDLVLDLDALGIQRLILEDRHTPTSLSLDPYRVYSNSHDRGYPSIIVSLTTSSIVVIPS